MGVIGQHHALATLYRWGKDPRYPLDRRKLYEKFLEGIVIEVTFRLGPEIGTLFINLKWNVS